MYNIYLDDGTVIEAELNANTWESDEEVKREWFTNNTNNVIYTDPDGGEVKLGECECVYMGKVGDKWLFGLNPLTDEQKAIKAIRQQRADLDYIAAMVDVEL